jgi:hypothetical protein
MESRFCVTATASDCPETGLIAKAIYSARPAKARPAGLTEQSSTNRAPIEHQSRLARLILARWWLVGGFALAFRAVCPQSSLQFMRLSPNAGSRRPL